MKKIFFLILIFGLFVSGVGYYYYQRNVYSKEVLKLEILGPEEVSAFEEIEYSVKYKNNGEITLEEPKLIFEYPKGFLPSDGQSNRVEQVLDDIYPGQERIVFLKGRLFGKENEVLTAKAFLKYRPKNLKAFYESKTTFSSKIKSVPLTFEIDLPSRQEIGREIKFSLNYFSNSNWPLSQLRVKIDYPFGFEFLESKPKGLAQNEWELPLLNKAEGGRIEIRGKFSGEIKEQKIFKAVIGFWKEEDFILLKETSKGTELSKPSLSVFQQINGSSNYIANPGDILHYEIFFRNISEEPFENLFLVARLEGRAFDFESVKTSDGDFQKNDNSILWDWRKIPKLKFLVPGEEGKVEFWINLKKDWEIGPSAKNSVLKNKITLSQLKEEFETKINSKLEIVQKGYYNDELGNSGPIPPRVGEITTYTIVWEARNWYNDLSNVKVKANLPNWVRLTGKIFPEDARFTFDSQSQEIVWEVGRLEIGQGVLNSGPKVAFQVSLLPLENQRGKIISIINEARIRGDDEFTSQILEGKAPAINTTLPDDSTVSEEQGIVQ